MVASLQVRALAEDLESLGCPYHITYAHEMADFIQQARTLLSPSFKGRISFVPILDGTLAFPAVTPFDYIAVGHIFNVSPYPPDQMLSYLHISLAMTEGLAWRSLPPTASSMLSSISGAYSPPG